MLPPPTISTAWSEKITAQSFDSGLSGVNVTMDYLFTRAS